MKSKQSEEGWWRFLKLVTELKTPELADDFFDLFLTADERDAMATRYLIVKDLLIGEKTQREMSKDLNVSIAKITRGSNMLKIISDKLMKFLEKKMT